MRDKLWLFIVVGKAALMTTLVYFALALAVLGSKIVLTHGEEEILGATMAFLPTGIAAWWIFRKLQARYIRRESRAAATALAVQCRCSSLSCSPRYQGATLISFWDRLSVW